MNKVDFSTGWNDHVFDVLKQKVSSMEKRDTVCSITFDAISIKEGLYYNRSTDKMDGFEDLGQYGASGKRARYAMVFMVKGIAKKWKQIVGYFLYGTSIKPDVLKRMITDCISKLQDTGLIPKVIICDQDTCNRSVFSKFGITPQSPNIIHNNEPVFFFFMYDTPHLLKSVRNNLIRHDVVINGQSVSWRYIEEFYAKDKQMSIRLAPKLTDKHIYCNNYDKMKVNLASQVFSRSVAAGIHTHATLGSMPSTATFTANFIHKMDSLFDMFNSSQTKHYRSSKTAISMNNINQIQDMQNWINLWEFTGTRNTIPCVEGWKLNVSALQCLWHDLNRNFEYEFLLTRRLNQDCLESLFSTVRNIGGNNDSPTTPKFVNQMKTLVTNNFLQSSIQGNCADIETPFLEFMDIKTPKIPNQNVKSTTNKPNSSDIEEEEEELLAIIDHYQPSEALNVPNDTVLDTISAQFSADSSLEKIKEYFSSFNPNKPDDSAIGEEELFANIDHYQPSETHNMLTYSVPDATSATCSIDSSLEKIKKYFSSFNPNEDDGMDHKGNAVSQRFDKSEEAACGDDITVTDNILTYISGYMCHKIRFIDKCGHCASQIMESGKSGETSSSNYLYLQLKGGESVDKMCKLNKTFIDIIKQYESIFESNVKDYIYEDDVRQKFSKLLGEVDTSYLLSCTAVREKTIDIYIRMRLHYYAKFINQEIRGKRPYLQQSCKSEIRIHKKLRKITHT